MSERECECECECVYLRIRRHNPFTRNTVHYPFSLLNPDIIRRQNRDHFLIHRVLLPEYEPGLVS